MFRAYLGPSSGGKSYVYNSWYLLFYSTTAQATKLTTVSFVAFVPPDDGPKYARNM